MRKFATLLTAAACVTVLFASHPVTALATSGSGLYETLSQIYGSDSSGGSSTASQQGTTAASQQTGGTGTELQGSQNINYHSVYSTEQQQKQEANQKLQPTAVQQFIDASGNTYYRYTNAAGQVITSTSLPEQQTIAPDIPAMDSDPIGPTIKTVSLGEYYHENYKLYEERFGDFYAIYSNVANGSITNQPAMFDVPAGVSVRMTRNGREVPFNNKTKIADEGTYVIQFYILEGDSQDLPAWQQTIDWAKFTFRIQYTAGLDGQPLVTEPDPSELESFADLIPENEEPIVIPEEIPEEEPAAEPEEQPAEQVQETPQSNLNLNDPLETEYDASTGYYKMTLLTGDSFYSNVPDGMVTNRAVLMLPNDNIRYELYKGGERVEYTPGEYIQEPGDYTMIPVEDNLDYEGYYRMGRPMMKFRVVTGPVSDLGTVSAPQAMQIAAVRHDSVDVTKDAMVSPNVASIGSDGAWEVDLQGVEGLTTVQVTRDTEPPVVQVQTGPNVANITYLSEDTATATLMRGNELISEGQLVQRVTQAGRYQLTVRDRAGNETVTNFSVQYRINAFAIIAIVMVVALIAAIVLLLRRAGTKVRVR